MEHDEPTISENIGKIVSIEMMEIVNGNESTNPPHIGAVIAEAYNELGASLRKWELLENLTQNNYAAPFTDYYLEILAVSERYAIECGGDIYDMFEEIQNILSLVKR